MMIDIGMEEIYVKLQLAAGQIIERSFHYSKYDRKEPNK